MHHIENTPEEVRHLLRQAQLMGLGAEVQEKLEWFLYYLENRKSVSQTCRHFGIARSTFYRWLQRLDPKNLRSLEERSHRPHMLRKPKVTQSLVDLIRIYRMQSPFMGKDKIARLLGSEHGMNVSASTVGRIITERNFYFGNSVLHRRKRMERASKDMSPLAAFQMEPMGARNEMASSEMTEFARASKSLFGYIWSNFRRPILVMSVLSNLALISLFLLTAAWESRVAEDRSVEQAAEMLEAEGHAAATEYGTGGDISSQPRHIRTYSELSPDG